MWKLEKVFIGDVQSVSKATIEIKQQVATLVLGKNLTEEDQESNGAGKSVSLEAVAMLLLGEPMRKLSMKKVIRRGSNVCDVSGSLFNSMTNQRLEIKREFFMKKSSTLVLKVDGEEVKFDTVNSGNEIILEMLELSREDIFNYYLMSASRYQSFLLQGEGVKKSLINSFAKADLVDPLIAKYNDEVGVIQTKIDSNQSNIDYVAGRIEAQDLLLKEEGSAKVTLEQEKNDAVQRENHQLQHYKTLQSQISQNKSDTLLAFNKAKNDYTDAFNKKEELSTELTELNRRLEEARANYGNSNKEYHELYNEYNRINTVISGAIECPSCKFKFSISTPEDNIEELTNSLPSIIENVNEKFAVLDGLKKDGESISNLKHTCQKNMNALNLEVSQKQLAMSSCENKYNQAVSADYSDQIKALEEKIKVLESASIDDPLAEVKKRISDAQNEKLLLVEKDTKLKAEIAGKKQLKHLSQRFKTFLINRTLSIIEFHCNDYLQRTGSSLSILIDGYSIDAKGKLREKIDIKVARNGIVMGDLREFSMGEQGKLELSSIYAFNTITNNKCKTGGLDFMFLDEVLVNIDSLGLEQQLKSLNSIGKTAMIITHATMKKPYIFTLTAVKENSITTFV